MTDWPIKTKSDEVAVERGYYFDEEKPRKVRKFIENFVIQGKDPWYGKNIKVQEWQYENIIKPLYGWFRPEPNRDGSPRRRFTQALIFAPKKCGKTYLSSGLALVHFYEQMGSHVAVIASDIKQANVAFSAIADSCDLHPVLKEKLWVKHHIKTIVDEARKATLEVLSSTPEGKSGPSYNFWLGDEIAEWNGTHARLIYDRLCNAGAARINPLHICISTSQFDRTHLGFELFTKACDILDGKLIDLHTLPVVYSLDRYPDRDWKDPETWRLVQPSLGYTVEEEYYREQCELAKQSPADEYRFKTLLLCSWCGSSQQWVSSQAWQGCYENFTEADLEGAEVVSAGVDLAMRGDLGAYVLLFRKQDQIYILPRFFSPEQLAAQAQKAMRVPFLRWGEAGHIQLTEGNVIDPKAILEQLQADKEKFGDFPIFYDPYGAELFRQAAEELGFDTTEVNQLPGSMSGPVGYFERLILDKKLKHNGNPCLTYCLQNCVPRIDPHERISIDKVRSRGRIDGIIAACIGVVPLLAEDDGNTWPEDMPLIGFL
jgi:phage terminase large subunit-like protein